MGGHTLVTPKLGRQEMGKHEFKANLRFKKNVYFCCSSEHPEPDMLISLCFMCVCTYVCICLCVSMFMCMEAEVGVGAQRKTLK